MLINLKDIHLAYTADPVFDNAQFSIKEGERLCLVGRNGAGKSTLMKLLAGVIKPDSGQVETRPGIKVSRLMQDVPQDISGSIYQVVADGLAEKGQRLVEYQQCAEADNVDMDELHKRQQALEAVDGWSLKTQIDTVLSKMQLDPKAEFSELSGGNKRRVLLAQALVSDPDLLLLDEPTNHLDIEAVRWLEGYLNQASFALVFITHDRAFLKNVASQIIEVDRGQVFHWPGDYAEYRQRKAEAIDVEQTQNREFDKKLAEEEAWVRRGVKARTKRNMGRVRSLEGMRDEFDGRRDYHQRARLRVQMGEQSGKRVFEAKNLSLAFDQQVILQDFNMKLLRGTKLGVIGPNGCGKSTLIKVLLGQIQADSGTIIEGTNLQVAYFDQYRNQLDEERTAVDNVADGHDKIELNGASRHVLGYLRDFLFTPERALTQVKVLSGGERNRLLLARLFSKPANVLILDEPTNDLDVETLELLEQLIKDYPGTVILVSHDREFVNNVVSGLLVSEGQGAFNYYLGNYDDWLRQRPKAAIEKAKPAAKAKTDTKPKAKSVKLSYKDQRELDQLPAVIEKLEGELETLQNEMNDPSYYQQDAAIITAKSENMARLNNELENHFERWEALETLRQGQG